MENVVFKAPSKDVGIKNDATLFGNTPSVKLAPGETILCVQRQHWLMLAQKMLLPIITLLVVFSALIYLNSLAFLEGYPYFTLIQVYVFLTAISVALLLEIHTFMDWYYHFYIITNRCLLHMHFFRIGGYYFDEVFLDQINQQEISRNASNFIYDLLELQDVTISFSKLERPEPFIFHTPSDSSEIEDILEELTVRDIEKKEKRM